MPETHEEGNEKVRVRIVRKGTKDAPIESSLTVTDEADEPMIQETVKAAVMGFANLDRTMAAEGITGGA